MPINKNEENVKMDSLLHSAVVCQLKGTAAKNLNIVCHQYQRLKQITIKQKQLMLI